MLRDSESEQSDNQGSDAEETQVTSVPNYKIVLRESRLAQGSGAMEQVLAEQAAQRSALQAAADQHQQVMADAATNMELVKIQAAMSMDIRKDIHSIDKFNGELGELSHFLRSCDGVHQMIIERQRNGLLDALGAASLMHALARRVHRRTLNVLQADETTPWQTIRQRLQKEYGGGRWTPDEDALRLLRLVRGQREEKGEFAARLLRAYTSVVEKYLETLPGPEASGRIAVIDFLVKVQLEEAAGAPVVGSVSEAASKIVDAADREEKRQTRVREPTEWRQMPRRAEGRRSEWTSRRADRPGERRRAEATRGEAGPPRRSPPRPPRRGGDQRCYTCGQAGHLQARCPRVRCFECSSPGHMARNCPYVKSSRRVRDEPMEINANRPARESRRKTYSQRRENSSASSDEEATEATTPESMSESEREEASTYAEVVRRRSRGEKRSGTGTRR